MPGLQRERCVPEKRRSRTHWNVGFSPQRGSNHLSIGAMPWLQRERCVPEKRRSRTHWNVGFSLQRGE